MEMDIQEDCVYINFIISYTFSVEYRSCVCSVTEENTGKGLNTWIGLFRFGNVKEIHG
jgi:hypothetical protein